MKRNIQNCAAVFLLECMVLLSAGSDWSGARTQRLYGSGGTDVWEIYGDHAVFTEEAWKQGWRVLEPLTEASFKQDSFTQYVNLTLDERNPRLVVIETPNKVWRGSTVVNGSSAKNATRQKLKAYRSHINLFCEAATRVANQQLGKHKDFVMEVPLAIS